MKRQQFRSLLIYSSFILFPLTYYFFSPYLIIWGASEGIVNGSFIVFGLLFLSSLFFGRAFCSWLCPASGYQDILQKGYSKDFSNGKKNSIKYLIWIPWIFIIADVAFIAGGYRSIDPMFQIIGTQNYSGSEIIYYFITYYIVLLVIGLLHFTLGQRGFCHTGCWMAPFMILGTKVRNGLRLPGFRLKSTSENCTSCKKCNKTCPMGLDVMNMVKQNQLSDIECIMCLNCVDTCKRSAIDFGFGFPKFQVENKEAIALQVRN